MPKYIDADKFLQDNAYFADRDFVNPKYDDTLRDLIDGAPAADVEPKQRWIPVTEDTPRSMVNKVLVFCSGDGEGVPDYVGFAHFEKYHGEEVWYNLETGKPFEEWGLTVTHWMDKPLPPKRG